MKKGPKSRSLGFAVKAMRAEVLGTLPPGLRFTGAATDSRAVAPGQLFFALPGERVDGFDFCMDAVKSGAAALVVPLRRGRPKKVKGIPILAVENPRLALGDLAREVRKKFTGRVVGITGSNGKTTTKELVAAALAAQGTVYATPGNLNTDVGLPRSILESSGDEAFWVLEMAMRGLGEIAYLAQIALPHVGVITNVAGAHLETLGSLEAVAKAKGELFHHLAPGGLAIFPAGDPLVENEASHLPEKCKIRFASPKERNHSATVRILEFQPAGAQGMVARLDVAKTPVVLRLPFGGEHNVRNAAAALAVAMACQVPPLAAAKAMENTSLPPHRAQLISVAGRTLVDDCYNANPASMKAALSALVGQAGSSQRAYAFLGDMLELGPASVALHAEIGDCVARLKLAGLVAIGPQAKAIADGARKGGLAPECIFHRETPEEGAKTLSPLLKSGDFVLFKASRGMRLERAVAVLQKELDR